MGTHSTKWSGKRLVLTILEIVLAAVVVVCAVLVFQNFHKYQVADREFQQVVQESQRDLGKLDKMNGDCVGWISVEDTRIDYPVMFTPEDPEHYLHRNFKDEQSFAGTPFIGEGSLPGEGNSFIVYAHHMRDGSMFASLLDFDKEDFGTSHEILYMDREADHVYRPIAAFYEDLTNPDCWRYWENVGDLGEKKFASFVKKARARSLYECPDSAEYGDKIIIMSTCSYGTSEQRFVVVGVQLDGQAGS